MAAAVAAAKLCNSASISNGPSATGIFWLFLTEKYLCRHLQPPYAFARVCFFEIDPEG